MFIQQKPLRPGSLDLGVVSIMIRNRVGLKKPLWLIIQLGVPAEIRTKTCIRTMPWLQIKWSSPPLPGSECLTLLWLPWRFSFQLNDQNSPFGGRPAARGAPHKACRAPAGAPSNTITSAAWTWEGRSVLRTAALWA